MIVECATYEFVGEECPKAKLNPHPFQAKNTKNGENARIESRIDREGWSVIVGFGSAKKY
jgi:hypothetical protein